MKPMELPISYSEFEQSLKLDRPDGDWPGALKAMWHDAKGDWEASHDIAQEMHDTLGSWMHAYLHRKEGDEWNAKYWYRRAGKPFPNTTLAEEHKELTLYILNQ